MTPPSSPKKVKLQQQWSGVVVKINIVRRVVPCYNTNTIEEEGVVLLKLVIL